MAQYLSRFLDENGKLKQLPGKQAARLEVFEYLAEKFEPGRQYTEPEVNEILSQWHTFHDYFTLRRGMIEFKFLSRKPDGSAYWREKPQE